MSKPGFPPTEESTEQRFKDVDCRSLSLASSRFYECIFESCIFTEAKLLNCEFVDCIFKNCDLSNVKLVGAAIRRCEFIDCKLIGVNWTEAKDLSHPIFKSCKLNYSNFTGLDLRKSSITDCLAVDVELVQANLSESDCRGTDFAGCRFANTNLTKADFRSAINYTIRPDSNLIKKAKFSLPEATLLLYGLDIILEE